MIPLAAIFNAGGFARVAFSESEASHRWAEKAQQQREKMGKAYWHVPGGRLLAL
jgi:hypothetical protein